MRVTGVNFNPQERIQRRLSLYSWLVIGVTGCLIAGIIWAVSHQIRVDYDRTLNETSRETMNLTRALEEHVRNILLEADADILTLKRVYETRGVEQDFFDDYLEHLKHNPHTTVTALFNEQGDAIVSTLPLNRIPNVSYRDYFQYLRSAENNVLNIGRPIIGNVSGENLIPLSRRINKPDGTFGGIVYMGLRTDVFTNFYQKMDLGRDTLISVTGLDGFIRARQVRDNLNVAGMLLTGGLLREIKTATQGTFFSTSSVDGVQRVRSFRVLSDFPPLIVTVGIPVDFVFGEHEKRQDLYRYAGALISLILIVLCVMLVEWIELILRRSEGRYRSLFDNMAEGVAVHELIFDSAGLPRNYRIVEVNESFQALLGVSKSDVVGKLATEAYGVEEPPYLREYTAVALTGTPVLMETYFRPMDKHFDISIAPWGEKGFATIFSDVSQSKQLELVQTALYKISEMSISSENLEKICQATYEIIKDLVPAEMLSIDLYEEREQMLRNVFRSYTFTNMYKSRPMRNGLIEYVIRTGQPQLLDEEKIAELIRQEKAVPQGMQVSTWMGVPIRSSDNRILGVISVVNGILYTPQQRDLLLTASNQLSKAIEHKLEEQKLLSLFRAVENTPQAIVIADKDGTTEYVNPGFSRMTGYSSDETIGKNYLSLLMGVHLEDFLSKIRQSLHFGSEWHGEIYNQRKDGGGYWQTISISCVCDEAGEILNYVSVLEDITERRQLEAERLESEKKTSKLERMASLGTLAAGVAHEINQPLQALKVTADAMVYWNDQGKATDHEKVIENCRRISSQAERIAKIVRRMRDFVNRSASETVAKVDMNEVVHVSLDMLRQRLLSHNVQLVEKLDASVAVMGDRGRLEEIVINIVVNALQALDTVEQDSKEIIVHTGELGNRLILEISNNGPLIPEDIIDRIFEPFFTSKVSKDNMGLGMAIVHSIVSAHKGSISVRNDAQGVTFRVELPAVAES